MRWKEQITANIKGMRYSDIEKFIDGTIDEEAFNEMTAKVDIPNGIPNARIKTFVKKECCRIGAEKLYELDEALDILDDEEYIEPQSRIHDAPQFCGKSDDADIVLPPTKVRDETTVPMWLAMGSIILMAFCITVIASVSINKLKDSHESALKIERTLRFNNTKEYELREEVLLDALVDEMAENAFLTENLRLLVTFLDAGIDKDLAEMQELVASMPYGSPFKSGHRVTDNYGFRDETWFDGDGVHSGLDLVPLQYGDNAIHTTVDGRIIDYGISDIYGKYIVFENTAQDVRIIYAHLATIYWQNDDHEVKGIDIPAGTKIGWMGATGLANGPHLHYELRTLVDGEWVLLNPKAVTNKEETKN